MENIFFEKKISSKKILSFQIIFIFFFIFFFFPCKKKYFFFAKKNNKLIIAERNERSSELVSELKSEKNSLSWTCLCARFNTAKMQMHCFSPDFSSCFLKIAKCSQSSIMNVSLWYSRHIGLYIVYNNRSIFYRSFLTTGVVVSCGEINSPQLNFTDWFGLCLRYRIL